ncbi:transcription factor SCREAM2-like [Argentina anserina]|uniref:transcription factor SCREAM2-like n=1 Tax=Argentina anserina TaxID=57926 RepID=UPI0021768FAB|nr:transcription factor SCREAM2-like [Potentilla anserina]
MVSKQVQKRAPVYKKLQSLRSISNSPVHSRSSIILDAVKYIQELKRKVEKMNQEIVATTAKITTTAQNPLSVQLKVEPREEDQAGFQIKMSIEKSCSGLLVFVLEAFEELGLDVLQARVSCSNNFLLEAVATINNDKPSGKDHSKDAEVVREAILQAIQSWSEVSQ